jgi:hypothetical protein
VSPRRSLMKPVPFHWRHKAGQGRRLWLRQKLSE